MKRIKEAAKQAIDKKKENLQSLKNRMTDKDTPLYQRVGKLAVETARGAAAARWSRMCSIWGIGSIAVVQGFQFAAGALPIMPSELDDPGQILGEYQAAHAEYISGAAAGSQMSPDGVALVLGLATMRNEISMARYEDLYDRGLEDARNGDITPPEIEAASRVLQDFETAISQQYRASF
ncbi:unnamed protein product, partial [Laminaria digitata]